MVAFTCHWSSGIGEAYSCAIFSAQAFWHSQEESAGKTFIKVQIVSAALLNITLLCHKSHVKILNSSEAADRK